MVIQRKKVYLAGKVSGIKRRLQKQVDASPTQVWFLSSDGETHNDEHSGSYMQPDEFGASRSLTKERFIDQLKECDFMIAVLDSPDSFGTIAEMAYASAIDVPCIAIIYRSKESEQRSELLDAYWFVSNFPGVVFAQVKEDAEALQIIDTLIKIESPMEWMFYHTLLMVAPIIALRLQSQAVVAAPDFNYRLDFLYDYMGKKVGVEIDGHDGHKSREQRTHDAQKDRFMKAQGLEVIRFTGTELNRELARCLVEFLEFVHITDKG